MSSLPVALASSARPSPSPSPSATPSWQVVACDNLTGAGPSSTCRHSPGGRRVRPCRRAPRDDLPAWARSGHGRVLGRALGHGWARGRRRVRRADEPDRAPINCFDFAARHGAQVIFSTRPRVPGSRQGAPGLPRGGDAFELVESSRSPPPRRGGVGEGVPARRGRGRSTGPSKARGRAAAGRVRRHLRHPRRDRPLRRHRRPVAARARSTRASSPTGCSASTSGGRWPTSATAAPASRSATCCTSSI